MLAWIMSVLAALPAYFTYKVVAALGIAIITTTGWTMTVNAAFALMASNLGGLPADVLAILNIMGMPAAFGIISGAITSGFVVRTVTGSITFGAA
jgi:cell division protein FtsX